MRYLTIDGFVKSFGEEQLWQMLDDYDKWQLEPYECYHDNCLLIQSTKAYCSNNHISFNEIDLYVGMITTEIYKYFALKYKETLNDPDSH